MELCLFTRKFLHSTTTNGRLDGEKLRNMQPTLNDMECIVPLLSNRAGVTASTRSKSTGEENPTVNVVLDLRVGITTSFPTTVKNNTCSLEEAINWTQAIELHRRQLFLAKNHHHAAGSTGSRTANRTVHMLLALMIGPSVRFIHRLTTSFSGYPGDFIKLPIPPSCNCTRRIASISTAIRRDSACAGLILVPCSLYLKAQRKKERKGRRNHDYNQ
ncbi:hypothetical protein BJY01DRAFT_213566 [Aspergillus pseudoustus]|uniref:Uncharacterized protein n=1 Tax=Aspergillus pseudoustus TaxID=1810923 RepID=A0ABR4K1J9_9EURO